MVVTFLLIPFIIRKLGEDIYGLWTLSFSIIGFFSLLDFGFGLGVVKWTGEAVVHKDFTHRNGILSTVFLLYVTIAAVGMLALAGFSLFYPRLFSIPDALSRPAVLVLLILGIRSLVIQVPLSLFKGVLFGEQRIARINIIQTVGTLLYAGSAWLMLAGGWGIVTLAIINCGAFLIENILYLLHALRHVEGLRISFSLFSRKYLRESLSFSIYSFITTIAGLVLFNTDAIIIQVALNLTLVGIYGVAIKITEYSLLLTKQLVNVLTPLISELKESRDDASIRFLLIDVSRYVTATGTLIAGSVYVFGSDLLVLWVGESFLSAAVPLMLLITAFMLSVPELIAANVLTMTGYHTYTAKISVSSIVVNIGISLLLVRPFGLTGIAVGTLSSSVINNVILMLRKAAAVYQFTYTRYVTGVFLPAILPMPVLLAAGFLLKHYFPVRSLPDLILKALPGIILYIGVFWICFVDRGIKQQLKDRLRRR